MQVTDEMVEAAAAQMMQYGVNAPESTIYAAARSALTAALAKAWRPIESAPTGDDDFFLVCGAEDPRSAFVVRGTILKKARQNTVPSYLSLHYVTHWMPLPEPPATKEVGHV